MSKCTDMPCCIAADLVLSDAGLVCTSCGTAQQGPTSDDTVAAPRGFAVTLPSCFPCFIEDDIRRLQRRLGANPTRAWQAAACYYCTTARHLGRTRLEVRHAWDVSQCAFGRHLKEIEATATSVALDVDDLVRKYLDDLQITGRLALDVHHATRALDLEAVAHRRPHAVACALIYVAGAGRIPAEMIQDRCGVSRRMVSEISKLLRRPAA